MATKKKVTKTVTTKVKGTRAEVKITSLAELTEGDQFQLSNAPGSTVYTVTDMGPGYIKYKSEKKGVEYRTSLKTPAFPIEELNNEPVS